MATMLPHRAGPEDAAPPGSHVTTAAGAPGRVTDFPPGFFDRADTGDDAAVLRPAAAGARTSTTARSPPSARYYDEVGVTGDVLDLMRSWVSHLRTRPRHLTVLGMNAAELEANPMADERVVHDLNADPALPFADAAFDTAVCTRLGRLPRPRRSRCAPRSPACCGPAGRSR